MWKCQAQCLHIADTQSMLVFFFSPKLLVFISLLLIYKYCWEGYSAFDIGVWWQLEEKKIVLNGGYLIRERWRERQRMTQETHWALCGSYWDTVFSPPTVICFLPHCCVFLLGLGHSGWKMSCWAIKSTLPSTHCASGTLDTEATKTKKRWLLPARNLNAVMKEILNACIYHSVKW